MRRALAALALVAALALGAACSDRESELTPTPPSAATRTSTATATTTAATASATTTEAAPSTPDVPTFDAPEVEPRLGSSNGGGFTVADPTFEPLPGAEAHFGILGTAGYKVEVPDDWNGGLVLYAHGVRLFTTELEVSEPIGPLRELLISQGFAWAASSYSETFYVPGIGADDTMALLHHFEDEFGEPERVYVIGESMGGNVVALLLENHPDTFDGALAVCGALGGEEQIDYLLSWAVAAEFASGVALPIGEPVADPNAIGLALIRALGPPAVPTPQGLQFAGIIREITGGPRPFFAEGLVAQFEFNFGLLLIDPERETVAVAAASNLDAVYDITEGLGLTADEVNTGVRRIGPVGDARDGDAHPDAVPTTGDISAPLLTLHNTGDLFVPINQEATYRAKAESHGKGDLIVQRAIRAAGHCRFSDAEYTAAWNDLVAWVEDGVKPAGDDLTGDLTDIGLQFTNPTRANDPGTR
jgi:pimeloyl-ACP methyl ester carboxylesterase